MQHFVEKDLGWCLEVKAFSGRAIVGCEYAVEVARRDGLEICFPGQKPAQSSMSVFDAAFLPGRVGIAEVGLESGGMEQEVSCELGSVVEGKCLSQVFRDHPEQAKKMLGDEVCGFVFGPCCEQDARASLVQREHELSVFGEADEIGFPVPGAAPIERLGIAVVNGNTGLDETCGASAAYTTDASFAFAPWQEMTPSEVFCTCDFGVDIAVDGFVADTVVGFISNHAPGDLFGRDAACELPENVGAQLGASGELGAGPASGLGLFVGILRLVSDVASTIALHLARNRRWRAIQSCRDFADGLAFGRASGNLTPVLK